MIMKEAEVAGLQHKGFPVCTAALWCFLRADNIQSTTLCLKEQHKKQQQSNNSLYTAISQAHTILNTVMGSYETLTLSHLQTVF